MTIERLSKLADWRLVDDSQDLRGQTLYDAHGNHLGIVKEMLVDTDQELVRWVVLGDGRRIDTDSLKIEESGVFVDSSRRSTETLKR